MNEELINRANVLFPIREYTDEAQVRHARRKWLQSIVFMRTGSHSMWILDKKVMPQKVAMGEAQ
jgi:hypothetical protein